MAATKRNAMLRPETAEKVRKQIQTTQLVKRLAGYALGEKDPTSKKPIEMTTGQITAALGLLKKALPDLASVEHSGDPEAPLVPIINVTLSKPEES